MNTENETCMPVNEALLQQTLSIVVLRGIGHLDMIREELVKLDVKQEDFESNTPKAQRASLLLSAAQAINATICEGYDLVEPLVKEDWQRNAINHYRSIVKKYGQDHKEGAEPFNDGKEDTEIENGIPENTQSV
jgi:hypothetical protein